MTDAELRLTKTLLEATVGVKIEQQRKRINELKEEVKRLIKQNNELIKKL